MQKSLSRKIGSRNSLIRNLTTSLILYEEIKTTSAKAREVKRVSERLITMAKKSDPKSVYVRRKLLGYLFDKNATKKMFEVLVPRYQKFNSGFVSTYKIGKRLGDGAELTIMKLREVEVKKEITGVDDAKKDDKKTK